MTRRITQDIRHIQKHAVALTMLFSIFSSAPVFSQCQGFFIDVESDPAYLTYCPEDTVLVFPVITGGTWPFTYEWSTGGTDSVEIYVALEEGWYTASVTVTDANGCVAYGSIHIKPTFWNLGWWQTGPACTGDGVTLTVTADGPNHTFLWSNGATGNPLTVYEPGTYTVTVTNTQYGCVEEIEFLPQFIPNPTPEIIGPVELCIGQTAELSLDTSYAQYSWSPSGESSSTITIDAPGTYYVTVTDWAAGCTGTDSIVVQPLSGIIPEISFPPFLCPENEGQIEISNASDFIDFLWSTGETTESITGPAPETYSVTATDVNGCIETGEVTIELFEITEPGILGDAEMCEEQETVTLTIEPAFVEYNWSTGETTPEITIDASGTYGVTVTDENGCTTTGEHQVDAAPIPEPFIQIPPETCDDSPELLSVNGAGGPYITYLWSNGEHTAEIVIYESGTFSVTVTNEYGCVGETYEETILIGTGPEADILMTSENCGESIILTATGGGQYTWSTGDTDAEIVVDIDGTYAVTVTDGEGCTDTASVDVTITDSAPVVISGPDVLCPGDTVSIGVTTSFAEYHWSTGDTGQDIQVTEAGTYTVSVTDANGCSGVDSIIIQAGILPDPQIVGPDAVCDGETVVLSLDDTYTDVLWSTGESTDEILAGAGEYWVTVTSIDGCSDADSISLSVHATVPVSIAGPESICTGGSTTLTAIGDYSELTWSTGEMTSSITVHGAGIYTVAAVDSNGCLSDAAHEIAEGDSLNPEITMDGDPCDGAITLNAGQGYTSYLWSNDSTASSILVSSPGIYSVTVADASGCSGSDMIEVTLTSAVTVQILGPASECADTTVTLMATSGMFSYVWSTGDTTDQINISSSGEYKVTATDLNGCVSTASHTYTQYDPPLVNINGPAAFCTGGTAILSVSGNYNNINWNNGDPNPQLSVTQPGLYSVTVTDQNGCTAYDDHTVTVADTLNPEITVTGSICDGFVTLDAGTGYSEYMWSTGETTSAIVVDTAGTYYVSVTDPGGCSGADNIALTFPQDIELELNGPDVLCEGTAGSISANPGFDRYLWSTGDTTFEITIAQAGVFTVTATDLNNCQTTASHVVEMLPVPEVEILGSDRLCAGSTVQLTVNNTYETISWNTGADESTLQIQDGGYYIVTVTDQNGCTATADITVTELQTDSVFMITETCFSQDTGTHVTALTNQYGCDSLIIEQTMLSPSLTTNITLNACAEEDVVYQDSVIPAGSVAQFLFFAENGCDSIVRVFVAEYPELSYQLEARPTCESESDGMIEVFLETAAQPCFYGINGTVPGPDPVFYDLPAGLYTIVVVDANGCSLEQSIEVREIEPLQVEIEEQQLTCEDPVVILTPTMLQGDSTGVSWLWSDGSTQPWMVAAEAGTYSLLLNDGCTEQEYYTEVTWATELENRDLFFVPNVFSPNGDGINDIFHVTPKPDQVVLDFRFQIFDRWGEKLFGTSDINDGWNGIFSGARMEPGVYVWFIQAQLDLCGTRTYDIAQQGDVTIVR